MIKKLLFIMIIIGLVFISGCICKTSEKRYNCYQNISCPEQLIIKIPFDYNETNITVNFDYELECAGYPITPMMMKSKLVNYTEYSYGKIRNVPAKTPITDLKYKPRNCFKIDEYEKCVEYYF